MTREMISSPLRIPKAITRPPKAMVVERRLSTVTIEDKGVQGGSEAGLARPMSALVAASDYGTLSLASLAMDSASSVLYSEDEDLDEEYDDLDEEDEDEEDQGRDDDDDDEGEESDDEGYAESLTSSGDSSRKRERQRKKKARKSRPRIFISDALYDEHPSPEGPATASFSPDGTGVVWGDGGRRRLGGGAMRGMRRPGGPTLVRGSLPTPTSLTNTLTTNTNTNGGIPPLWPDYEANEEEEMNATATFIGGYVYEDVDFKFGEAECEWSVRSRSISMSRGEWEEDDLEAQMGRKAVARQPVGSFDFDALPLPPPSILRRNQSGSLGGHSRANTGEAEDEEKEIGAGDGYGKRQERYLEHQQQKQRRRVEMQSVSRGGGGGWRWRMLVYIQTKCGPGNAVSSQLRKVANDTTGGSGSGRTSPAGSEKSRFGVGWFGMHPVLEKHEGSVVATTTPTAGFTSLLMKMFGRSRGCENDLNVEEHPDLEKQSLKAQNGSSSPITWKQGFKKVSKVPAFAAPLTPVLNPVVGRAQWEIVVRSAVVSAFVSLVVVGGLVAVPVVG